MRKVWAIAIIAMRNAIRSKVVGVMIILLAITAIGLPLTIHHDGTVYGQVKVMLHYSLALITFILAVSTMWAGCAAVSLEIQEKQMHLVVTKPVTALQIWLGKWLGLCLINAVLLGFSGVVIFSLMKWTMRPAVLTEAKFETLEQEVMIARRAILPTNPSVDERAHAMARERMAMGQLPPNTDYDDLYSAARWKLIKDEHSIKQNEKRTWEFRLDPSVPREPNTLFRFRFTYPQMGADAVQGYIRVRDDQSRDLLSMVSSNAPNHVHAFRLANAIPEDATSITVEYTNANPTPITLLFSGDEGMQMLVRKGSFLGNYTRALFLIFIQLAFIGAIGLTAGTLFSMPVAALTSCYIILLFSSSGYIEQHAGKESILAFQNTDPPAWLESLLHGLFNVLHLLLKPLQQLNYSELLALGVEIPLSMISSALFFKLILYTGLMAILGSVVFSKREIALPST